MRRLRCSGDSANADRDALPARCDRRSRSSATRARADTCCSCRRRSRSMPRAPPSIARDCCRRSCTRTSSILAERRRILPAPGAAAKQPPVDENDRQVSGPGDRRRGATRNDPLGAAESRLDSARAAGQPVARSARCPAAPTSSACSRRFPVDAGRLARSLPRDRSGDRVRGAGPADAADAACRTIHCMRASGTT